MDSNLSPADLSSSDDYGFAFNDRKFSDRVLRIEIVSDSPDGDFGSGEVCASVADWACNRKRRREEMKKEIAGKAADDLLQREEQIVNCSMPDSDDGLAYENQDEEAVAMVEGSPSGVDIYLGDEDDEGDDPTWSKDCSEAITVKSIHINSLILAAKSPFFFKLFSNGMKESEQQHVSLRIYASEEAALMDLLSFMYCGNLSTTTRPALLNVLMAADKFEVASCMRYCCMLLCNLPMTCQSAMLYLDLPSTISMGEAVQTLTDAAKQFLAARYKDLPKFQDEVLNLPLAGLEAVLSSDDLQVASEDAIYDFVLKWARLHYPKLEERKEVLGSRLARLVRFPFMTCRKLKKALTCTDLDSELASKLVLDSLFFKAEAPHRQRALAAEEATHRRFVERAYRYRPIKVVEFELPRQHCIVYLDLRREECSQLFPSGRVYSQAFHLGGQGFFLSAHCNADQQSSFPPSPSQCFGLFLGMQEKGSVSFSVDYEFAARSSEVSGGEFMSKYKGNYTFTGGKAVGYRNLCGVPWSTFIAEDSPYFINGILHLRAELTMRQRSG